MKSLICASVLELSGVFSAFAWSLYFLQIASACVTYCAFGIDFLASLPHAPSNDAATTDAAATNNSLCTVLPLLEEPGPYCQAASTSCVVVNVASSDSELSSTASPYSRGTPATASRGSTTW